MTGRWKMRGAAAAVLVAAALAVGGQSASADCFYPPDTDFASAGWAGQIDRGPEQPTGSVYSQFGYGGYALPVYEGSPCIAGVSPRPSSDIGTKVAVFMLWLSQIITAVCVFAARFVFDTGGVWSLIQLVFGPVNAILPGWFLTATIALGVTVSACYLAWRARKAGRTRETARRSGGVFVIVMVAFACLAWSAVIPASQSQMIATALSGVQTAATGNAGRADVAIGDAMTNNLLMPTWSYALLGPDKDAVDKYAWRLRAASTVSRDEYQRCYSDAAPAACMANLMTQKQDQYKDIAAEIKESHPQAYRHLSGDSTKGRAETAMLGFGTILLSLGVLLAALIVVAIAKTVLPVVMHLFPIAASALQFPKWHKYAAAVGSHVWGWTLAAMFACIVFVLWMLGPMRSIADAGTDLSKWERFGGLALLYVVFWLLWRFRANVRNVKDRVDKARERDPGADLLGVTVESVQAEVQETWSRWRKSRREGVDEANEVGEVEDSESEVPPPSDSSDDAERDEETDREVFREAMDKRVKAEQVTRAEQEQDDADAGVDDAGGSEDADRELFADRVKARLQEAKLTAMEGDELDRRHVDAAVERERAEATPEKYRG